MLTAAPPSPAPAGGEEEVLPWRAVEAIPIYVISIVATFVARWPVNPFVRLKSEDGT